MTELVNVRHPVVHRYVSARGRTPRIGVAEGMTPYTPLHAGSRPRELVRIGSEAVYEADGKAWTMLVDSRERPTPKRLFELLGTSHRGPGGGHYEREIARSPMHYRDNAGEAPHTPFVASPRDRIVEDGSETAHARVRAYLDETFRLAGDRVMVRFRPLVRACNLHLRMPTVRLQWHPRTSDGGIWDLGVRHDRVHELTALMEADQTPDRWELRDLDGIPGGILDDHDVEYAANALPARVLGLASRWVRDDPTSAVQERLARAIPTLRRLDEDSWTHGTTGDRVEPALMAIRDALLDIRALQEGLEEQDPTRDPRPAHVTARLTLDLVDKVHLPRWRMRGEVSPEDEATLGGLAR